MENLLTGNFPQHNPQQAASRSLHQSPSEIIAYIADVEVQLIEPVPYISDFQTPSNSYLPYVIQSGEHFYCIDGWHKVEVATSEGATTIACRVKVENEPLDPSELAIRKVAVRIAPELGRVCYAEQLMAVRQLYNYLKLNRPNLLEYGHGGTRVAGASGSNTEDDLYSVLESRLGRSRTTIQRYIGNSKYLTDESMEALIEKGATQQFFDAAKRRRRNVVNIRENDGDSEEITAHISAEIINWHQEFINNDGKLLLYNPLTTPDQLPDNPVNNGSDDNRQQTVEDFNFHTPLTEDASQPQRTFQDYMADFNGIQDRVLVKRNDVENNSSLKALLTEMVQELIELAAQISDTTEGEGENQQTSEVA